MNKIKQVAAKLKNEKTIYCPRCQKEKVMKKAYIFTHYCDECLHYFIDLKHYD